MNAAGFAIIGSGAGLGMLLKWLSDRYEIIIRRRKEASR